MTVRARVIPCLDVANGRVVKGVNFVDLIDAGDPVEQARAYDAAGADELCFLDITASHEGRDTILEVVRRTAAVCFMPLTVGGGVRSADDVERLLEAGVHRVVIGSLAVTQPDAVLSWLERFGADRITLALDVKIENDVPVPALRGWTESSGVDLWTALDRYPRGVAKHLLVTDVSRDGALTGPNLQLLSEIRLRRPDMVLQASGGVASLDDIAAVKALGCNGAIVGRALYEGRFTLPEAIAAAKRT